MIPNAAVLAEIKRLYLETGKSQLDISLEIGCSPSTVAKWIKTWIADGTIERRPVVYKEYRQHLYSGAGR